MCEIMPSQDESTICESLGLNGWIVLIKPLTWWRHQMETFSALLAICAGNSTVPGEVPTQGPVTRSFDVFFDLRPNKRLSKQLWGWCLRRHRAHYDVIVMEKYWYTCILHELTAGWREHWWMDTWVSVNHMLSFHRILLISPGQNGRHFGRRHFQMHFIEWKW